MRKSLLLEIGRIYHSAHQRAAETLARLGEKHTHPLADIHTPYLRSRGELVRALHDHRALLCYPGAVSHPNGRTGNWHSMTHRYLEAVSTKTLVLGHVPSEMETLFGFRPGVNATPDELPRVIQVLINEPENYQEIVDRSYKRLLQVATWDVRVRELCAIQSGTEYAGAPTTDRG